MRVTERDLPWLTRTSAMVPKGGTHSRRTGHPSGVGGTVGACQRSALLERCARKRMMFVREFGCDDKMTAAERRHATTPAVLQVKMDRLVSEAGFAAGLEFVPPPPM